MLQQVISILREEKGLESSEEVRNVLLVTHVSLQACLFDVCIWKA